MNNMNDTRKDAMHCVSTTITAILFAMLFFGCGEHSSANMQVSNGEGQNGGGNGGTDDGSCDIKAGSNGFEVFCGDELVGYLGGSDPGAKGDDGDDCRVEAVSDGYDIYCGDATDPVGRLNHGASGTNGTSCTTEVDENNSAWFVMKCGGVEKAKWAKAWCGATAYDPEVDVCKNGKIAVSVQEVDIDGAGMIWMAKNLDVVPDGAGGAATKSWCYDGDEDNCETYGRLYDWATAMALDAKCNTTLSTSDPDCAINTPHQGICPDGFHIPTDADWNELFTYVGSISTAGSKLKSETGWTDCGPVSSGETNVCEDAYDFSALPGGIRGGAGIVNTGIYGYWWRVSESSGNNANTTQMSNNKDDAEMTNRSKASGISVRCVKDD